MKAFAMMSSETILKSKQDVKLEEQVRTTNVSVPLQQQQLDLIVGLFAIASASILTFINVPTIAF